jgi:hypothetical protein
MSFWASLCCLFAVAVIAGAAGLVLWFEKRRRR